MNEETQPTLPAEESAADIETTLPDTTTETRVPSLMFDSESGVVVTAPIDFRESTIYRTEKGDIHVIHEITLGDVILSTLMMAMIIFLLLDRVIRR